MNFLSDFWDSVVDAVVGGTTYTIEWFQQIGLAVAGALGYVFAFILKFFWDFGQVAIYYLQGLFSIFSLVFKPFVFLTDFFTNALPSIDSLQSATSTISSLSDSAYDFFNMVVPSFVWGGVYALVVVVLLIGAVKSFKKL